MNKWIAAGTMVLSAIVTTGCVHEVQQNAVPAEARNTVYKLPMSESQQEAYLASHRLFVDNLQKGKPDWLLVTTYTDEGDPILKEYKFDGKRVELMVDTTKDKFSSHGEIVTFTCAPTLETQESNGSTLYNFTDCDSDRYPVTTLYFEPGD